MSYIGWLLPPPLRMDAERPTEQVFYTPKVGVSDESDTIPRGAASGAYSTGRRVIAHSRGVRP